MKIQVNGWAYVVNSKKMTAKEKAELLAAPKGHHVELRLKIPNIQAQLREHTTGTLSCKITAKSEDCELVVVPDKHKEETTDNLVAQAESLL